MRSPLTSRVKRATIHAMSSGVPSRFLAVFAALVLLTTGTTGAQQASLRTVLERAGQYVGDFDRRLGGIVSEERYLQDVFASSDTSAITGNIPGRDPTRGGMPRQHRELKSDLLLLRPLDTDRWVQFRDVFDVDGVLVHGRDDRLANLFLKPSDQAGVQLRRIAEESARYNIGNLERTINVPVLPLVFLDPDVQARFEFNRVLDAGGADDHPSVPRDVPNVPAFVVPQQAMEIEYKETGSSTLIRTTADRDLPARGRFWIEPGTGSVLMTEVILDDPWVHAAIHVSYRLDSSLGFLVPLEMREHYVVRASGVHIYGIATYSKFRRFQVNVDERIAPLK